MVAAATAAPCRPGRPGPPSARPAATPHTGPSATFWGRTPRTPPSVPVIPPIATGPAPNRSAAQPSGATSAALAAIRDHSAGISPGACRARAAASVAARAAAPSAAPAATARGPRWAASAAPATAPIVPLVANAPSALERRERRGAGHRRPRSGATEATVETYSAPPTETHVTRPGGPPGLKPPGRWVDVARAGEAPLGATPPGGRTERKPTAP